MSRKSKGSDAERELLHRFWNAGWGCMRAAGSGSIQWPEPDLIAGNRSSLLAIECKATIGNKKYFDPKEIEDLRTIAELLGAKAVVGVKFNRHGWVFREAKNLEFKGKMPCMDKKGLTFEELTKL
jgi:Holliday junction resolvase